MRDALQHHYKKRAKAMWTFPLLHQTSLGQAFTRRFSKHVRVAVALGAVEQYYETGGQEQNTWRVL